MYRAALVSCVIALAILVLGCDQLGFTDGRPYSYVADNRSDEPVQVRVTRAVATGDGVVLEEELVTVPPDTRVVLAQQRFSGDRINALEVLGEDCATLLEISTVKPEGSLVQIDDGPTAALLPEYPEDTPGPSRGASVGACP